MNINSYQDDRPLKEKKDDFFGGTNSKQTDESEEQKEFFGPQSAARNDREIASRPENSSLNEVVVKPALEGPDQEDKLPAPPTEPSLPKRDVPAFTLKPQEPQIGVELTDKETAKDNQTQTEIQNNIPDETMAVPADQAQPGPVNNDPRHLSDDSSSIQTHSSDDLPNYRPATPPIKQSVNGKTLSIMSGAALVVIVIAFGASFFGFKYYPQLISSRSTMADTDTTSNVSTKDPSSVEMWPIYSNTNYKYSVKYPDTWHSTGTGDPTSMTVAFSDKKVNKDEDLDGYLVTISFQEKNGKELKDWIETNNIISKDKGLDLTETEISVKKAYTQKMADPTQMKAYVEQENKIMVIAYEASTDFDSGKVIYDEIVESIKLL